MKFTSRTLRALILASIGALVVTGCAGKTDGGGTDKVLIQYNPTAYSWLGIVAEKAGIFDENGIDAELKQIDNGTLATTALASGDVTLAFQDLSLVSPYLNKGQDFTAVTATGNLSWDIVAPGSEKPTSFPESVADLKGKKIGVPALGTVAYYYAQAYLKEVGIDPKEVDFVAVGPFAQVPAVIANGQVDAAVVTPDQTFQLQQTSEVDVLFSAVKDKDKLSKELATVVGTPGSFYFAQTKWVNADQERTENVQKSLVQAQEWAQDPANITELTKILKDMKLLPANIQDDKKLEEFVSYATQFMNSQAAASDMQAYVDFWTSNGVLSADVTGEQLLSPTIPSLEAVRTK